MGGGKKQTLGYSYFMGLHMGVCKGPIDALLSIMAADRVAWTGNVTESGSIYVNAPELFGGTKREGGIQGVLDVMFGEPTQEKNDYLVAQLGERQPAYRGIFSTVFRKGLVAAMNPYLKPWAYRVRRVKKGWESGACWYEAKAEVDVGDGIKCANPAHVVYEILTDTEDGMGYPAGELDAESFEDGADLFHSEGLGLWVKWMQSEKIDDMLRNVLDHANAFVIQDPRTLKFRLVPMRNDYLLSELPSFGPKLGADANVGGITYDVPCVLEEFERSTIEEAVNEVTVTWDNSRDNLEGSITIQNLAAIQAAGGVVNQTKAYACAPTEAIAARLAQRDVDVLSATLARIRLRCDRRAFDAFPGQVIKLSWPPLGIYNVPVRVLRVTTGNISGGEITIEGTEDVFGFGTATYLKPQDPGWVEPDPTPQASPAIEAFEVPFRDLVQVMGMTTAQAQDPDAGYLGMAAARPTGIPVNFELYAKVGSGDYVDAGAGDFTPTGTLAGAVTRTGTSITLTGMRDMGQLEVGDVGFLGAHPTAEAVRVDAIAGDTLTIGRGCLDTVAKAWPSGTRFWGYDNYGAASSTEYTTGELVSAKAATNATQGQLALADSPTDTVTMNARQARPYPPQTVTVNGQADPVSLAGELTVVWRHRDRILQADTVVDHTAASIGPEPGVTYLVRLRNAVGTVIYTSAALPAATTSHVFSYPYNGDATLEVVSVRDGLESWQANRRAFEYFGTPITITTTSVPAAQVGVPYSFQLLADGGEPPLEWTLFAGTLPDGFELTLDGELVNPDPAEEVAPTAFTVQAEGPVGVTDTQALSIQVLPAELDFPGTVLAYSPTWYCRHNEASGTVAVNEVGDDGVYGGTPVFGAPAIYTGGLTCWDTNAASHCDIPASVMPSPTSGFTLGILLKRNTHAGLQAVIDRDPESGGRWWQWRFESGPDLQAIKIIGGVQTFLATGVATTGDTVLLHFRVKADGTAAIFKNGTQVGTGTFSAADYGTAVAGLRIGRRLQGDSQADYMVAESMVYRTDVPDEGLAAQAAAAGLA